MENLQRSDVFAEDTPQHVSNTLWGLGKMDVAWSTMPHQIFEKSLVRCGERFSNQEICNAVYGMAKMDAIWTDLAYKTRLTIVESLEVSMTEMTIQESANLMYSAALLTFDADYSDLTTADGKLLYRLHKILLQTFSRTDYMNCEKENYDQYGIYFELLEVIPIGLPLIEKVLGAAPRLTGPCGTVPSRLHAKTAEAMLFNLRHASKHFDAFNEFNGLRGVFPVDCAVYYKDRLVALVEVDGEFHYKQSVQELRRKDQLKQFLYR